MAEKINHRVWIEDGILYNVYRGELSLKMMLEVAHESSRLLAQEKIALIPLIVILENIGMEQVKIKLNEYGKILHQTDILSHSSAIWIVGVDEKMKTIFSYVVKLFLLKKFHFANSLEEAKQAAKASKNDGTIFESEIDESS